MNGVFGYSLAVLLAAGGPAAIQASKPDSQLLAQAAAPAPGTATASKPLAGTSETKPAKPPVAMAPGSASGPTGTPSAKLEPESAIPATGLPVMPATGLPVMPANLTRSPDRPAWVDEPSGLGEGGAYLMHVYVGPELSRTECEPKLTAEIGRRLLDYAAEMGGDTPVEVPYDTAKLRPRIVTQMWEERIRASPANLGDSQPVDLVYLHAQIRIDDKLRREWKAQGIESLRSQRSRVVMIGYAGAIAAAVAVFVLLRWSRRGSGAAGPLLPVVTVVAIIVGFVVMVKFYFGA